MYRLLKRHVDCAEQVAFQYTVNILRHAGRGGRAVSDQNHPAIRTGINALAVMTTLFQEQAQPDHFRRRALNMQQFINFAAQQRGVIVFIFAAIEDQTGRVELGNQPALDVANQRQEVLAQRIHQVFRQRKRKHLFHAADQQRHAFFDLIAITRWMRHAIAAVEAIFENRAELVFQDSQRFRRRDITVAQIDIFTGQEAVKQIALFDFRPGRQRRFQRR